MRIPAHKERHRGPEAWLEPTGEMIEISAASDYDVAAAMVEAEGPSAIEIARHIAAERRYMLRGGVKTWAGRAGQIARDILRLRPFLEYIVSDGRDAYGASVVHVVEEESPEAALAEARRRGASASATVHRPGDLEAPREWTVEVEGAFGFNLDFVWAQTGEDACRASYAWRTHDRPLAVEKLRGATLVSRGVRVAVADLTGRLHKPLQPGPRGGRAGAMEATWKTRCRP